MPREAMTPCKTHLPSLYPSQRSHPTPVEGGKEAGAEGRGGRETDPGGGGAVGAAVEVEARPRVGAGGARGRGRGSNLVSFFLRAARVPMSLELYLQVCVWSWRMKGLIE